MNINQAFPRRGTGGADISIPEIVGRLTGNIGALCEYLLPNGRREGAEWRCGSVQGEPGKSLGVHLAGAKAVIWADFADDSKGDPLDLVQACLGIDKGGAVLWAKDWLGERQDTTKRWRELDGALVQAAIHAAMRADAMLEAGGRLLDSCCRRALNCPK